MCGHSIPLIDIDKQHPVSSGSLISDHCFSVPGVLMRPLEEREREQLAGRKPVAKVTIGIPLEAPTSHTHSLCDFYVFLTDRRRSVKLKARISVD